MTSAAISQTPIAGETAAMVRQNCKDLEVSIQTYMDIYHEKPLKLINKLNERRTTLLAFEMKRKL